MAVIRWASGKQRIDRDLALQQTYLVQHHRAVLSVVIDCCRYLSREMLALRNSKSTKGKLFNLFVLLSKYNADAKSYLLKIQEVRSDPTKSKMQVNFLAYRSVLTLVTTMKEMVLQAIVDRMKKVGKYSIIADGTQDCSKLETVVLLVRYIESVEGVGSSITSDKPVERTVGAFTLGGTSGKEMADKCKDILNECHLDLKNVVGQSYDGAANMRGSAKGMKTLIQEAQIEDEGHSTAIYIWCYAHRFSLVIERALENSIFMGNHFGISEELYVFMSGHKRHYIFTEVLKDASERKHTLHLSKRRLQRVSTTRWSSRPAATSTINDCFEEIVASLEIIKKDEKSTTDTRVKATGLLNHILTVDFIAGLKICMKLFSILRPITSVLQGVDVDLGAASIIISDTKKRLEKFREDNREFDEVKDSILEMCVRNKISTAPKIQRKKMRKRFFDEMGTHDDDDGLLHIEKMEKFKIDVYYIVIDRILMEMSERFTDSTLTCIQQMNFFTDKTLQELKEIKSKDVEELCEMYNLDSHKIAEEYNDFKKIYSAMCEDVNVSDLIRPTTTTLMEIENEEEFQKMEKEDEEEEESEKEDQPESAWLIRGFTKPFRLIIQLSSYGYLRALYKILITLPVTSCSAERALSKHRIVKNYLRSTMLDPYMSSMLILASEKDVLDDISNEVIIDKIATKSLRYKKLLF